MKEPFSQTEWYRFFLLLRIPIQTSISSEKISVAILEKLVKESLEANDEVEDDQSALQNQV